MTEARSAARFILCVLLAAVVLAPPASAASRPAERARHAMVSGPEALAVNEAVAVLREGGNAVDAAVTMGFVLAVTAPWAGNIGGGGFMLIRPADGEPVFIDYREVAPAASTRDMYLDDEGNPIPMDSVITYRATGVPGTVAGLALALEKQGSIELRRALAPAIRLAREGFPVGRGLERALAAGKERISRYPASAAIFHRDGEPLREGDLLVQEDLARTLERIASNGVKGFYEGETALALEKDMRSHGGILTAADLAAYRPIVRQPLSGAFGPYRILTAPPSSSGGVALLQILGMIESRDPRRLGHNSSAYIHLVAEAMKRAYADRSRWLGDPEFFEVPLAGLLSPGYVAKMMADYDPDRATPAGAAGPGIPPGAPPLHESTSTTHFSVVDSKGNAVSNTYTLNAWFGNGAVATGLGFLLNNEMDDFSIKPGVANLYELVGGEANSIAPGKRMLSSMTPTIVLERDEGGRERPLLVLGSPGGSTIITSVLQTILNLLVFDMEPQAAVDAPRFHHQWSPDRIRLEQGGFPLDVVRALEARGHEVVEGRPRGEVQAVIVDREKGWLLGASDSRGFGVSRGY